MHDGVCAPPTCWGTAANAASKGAALSLSPAASSGATLLSSAAGSGNGSEASPRAKDQGRLFCMKVKGLCDDSGDALHSCFPAPDLRQEALRCFLRLLLLTQEEACKDGDASNLRLWWPTTGAHLPRSMVCKVRSLAGGGLCGLCLNCEEDPNLGKPEPEHSETNFVCQ